MWRSVEMPDAEIFTVPMEFSLKFVAIIGLRGLNPEGELVPLLNMLIPIRFFDYD